MLAMTALYIHYRVFDVKSGRFYCKMNDTTQVGLLLAAAGVVIQVLFIVMQQAWPFNKMTSFSTFLKTNAMLILYIGYTIMMYCAFYMQVPFELNTYDDAPFC